MNSRSRSIREAGLVACAAGFAWGALCFALRSGSLSAPNGIYAAEMGAVIYVICRGVSLAPIATSWSPYLKFFVAVFVGACLLYLRVVWMNGST